MVTRDPASQVGSRVPGRGLPESGEMDTRQHICFWASPPTSPQGPQCQNHQMSHRRVSPETSEKFT